MLERIVYGLIWLLSLLPLKVLYLISDVTYFLLYYIVRYRRKVVRENLTNSFPEKSVHEIKVIEKKFYSHLCDIFVESYRMWNMSEKEMRKRCSFKNPEVINHYFAEGKNVAAILGHYANWEWMASFGMWMPDNVDFLTLYKPLHSKILDDMMLKIRSRFRATLVPKNDVLRRIVQNRREKRLFLLAFIGDQTPNAQNLNFWMEFLHQDTPILVGTEKIARKFDLPVITLNIKKVKRGYYEIEFYDLCRDPKALPEGELTRMHTHELEKRICENPELWLWSHRRWKHKREDK